MSKSENLNSGPEFKTAPLRSAYSRPLAPQAGTFCYSSLRSLNVFSLSAYRALIEFILSSARTQTRKAKDKRARLSYLPVTPTAYFSSVILVCAFCCVPLPPADCSSPAFASYTALIVSVPFMYIRFATYIRHGAQSTPLSGTRSLVQGRRVSRSAPPFNKNELTAVIVLCFMGSVQRRVKDKNPLVSACPPCLASLHSVHTSTARNRIVSLRDHYFFRAFKRRKFTSSVRLASRASKRFASLRALDPPSV